MFRELIQNARRNPFVTAFLLASLLAVVVIPGCGNYETQPPVSSSGVKKASVHVATGSDGLTTEQRNVQERLQKDNQPGAIKHLYVISAYSGQVLIYSTVKGKVTSSGKRLTPVTVSSGYNSNTGSYGIPVNIGGRIEYTSEVLQDDGTYGSSVEYLYWWDTRDIYHQHYIQGGQILHVSDQPIAVKNVVINMEMTPVPASKSE